MIYMSQNQARTAFHQDKSLAMYIDFMGNFVRTIPTSKVNWDMALTPVFPDRPNTHTQIDFHAAYVSKLSSNKEAAADVIGFMSTTRYLQAEFSDRGRIPAINNLKILQQFGSQLLDGNNKPLMLNKNLRVLEKSGVAPSPPVSNYENEFALVGANFMSLTYQPFVTGKKDLTTALREGHEKINSSVKAAIK
jgi:ABC-type glycerol-3-phosphate transport system substrate-binding protein